MSMPHHYVNTKRGTVIYYLNPEYIYSTQQMWIIKCGKETDYWFFHRNYSLSEIKNEIINLITKNEIF